MKSKIVLSLTVVLTVILFASSAFAWRSLRTGQRNFERAWNNYLSSQPDKAAQHFAKAADGFAKALAENPPSRTTMFASNLAMAGISFYNAGRDKETIKTMAKAAKKDKDLWEAYLYAGLSQAHLGNTEEVAAAFNAYLETSPSQPILSNEVGKQLEVMDKEPTDVEAVATAVEAALFKQLRQNFMFDRRYPVSPNGFCAGSYWWRYNKAPCERAKHPLR